MLTKEFILKTLRDQKHYFENELGVKSIGLFGSFVHGNQKDGSDVDLLIDMPPNFDDLCTVWKILEGELNTKIDLVRVGPHLGKSFLKDIRKEIIYS